MADKKKNSKAAIYRKTNKHSPTISIDQDGRRSYTGFKQVCNCCGKSKAIDNNYFRVPHNNLCMYDIYPVCTKCLKEEFDKISFEYGEKIAFRTILRKMDRPYLDEYVIKTLQKQEVNQLSSYLRVTSSLKQYYNMTYDDSDFGKIKSTEPRTQETQETLDEFSDDDWNRWDGYGLEAEEIATCQKYYNTLMNKYEFKNVNEETAVEQLAVFNLKMKKAVKDDDALSMEKLKKIISSTEADLNIQSRQRKDDLTKNTFGNWIRMIENTEPIPKAAPEFEDVDGIWSLIRRYILGFLPVAMGKAREEDVLGEDSNILDKYRSDSNE